MGEAITVQEQSFTHFRLTIDDVDRMVEIGVLKPDDRVELIEGQLIEMPLPGSRHARYVDTLNEILVLAVHGRAIVRVQNALLLDRYNAPVPDLAVVSLRDDRYEESYPGGPETLLAIEICDTTLSYDRRIKAPLYARRGVRELWLVDVTAKRVEVFRRPGPDAYDLVERMGADAVLRPEAFEDVEIPAASIF